MAGLMNQHKETSVRAFRRTEAGTAALEDKNSGLSVAYRRILEQVGGRDGLRPLLSSYSKAQLVEWLGQLRSEEHTSELQSLAYIVCRLLLEKKKKNIFLVR